MVLHGRGWGDNLALRHGVTPALAADDPRVLRLPHNIFFSLVGRARAPDWRCVPRGPDRDPRPLALACSERPSRPTRSGSARWARGHAHDGDDGHVPGVAAGRHRVLVPGRVPVVGRSTDRRARRRHTFRGSIVNVQDAFHHERFDYVPGSPHLKHDDLRDAISTSLRSRVEDCIVRTGGCQALELGAGHGTFTDVLVAAGADVVVSEMSSSSTDLLRVAVPGKRRGPRRVRPGWRVGLPHNRRVRPRGLHICAAPHPGLSGRSRAHGGAHGGGRLIRVLAGSNALCGRTPPCSALHRQRRISFGAPGEATSAEDWRLASAASAAHTTTAIRRIRLSTTSFATESTKGRWSRCSSTTTAEST